MKRFAFAGFAAQHHIRKKLHLHDLLSGSLAVLAAAARGVEREKAGFVTLGLGLPGLTEESPDLIHGLGVGGGDGAG